MNLKLKRLVRTTSSEQYALFDLDQTDEEDDLPLTIGKLDLHYTAEGVYGTMLLWDDASRNLRPAYRRAFVQALLEDIVQPMGVPNEYVVEFFAPTLDYYEVFHNVEIDEDEDLDEDVGEETVAEDERVSARDAEAGLRRGSSGQGRPVPYVAGDADAGDADDEDADEVDADEYDADEYETGDIDDDYLDDEDDSDEEEPRPRVR